MNMLLGNLLEYIDESAKMFIYDAWTNEHLSTYDGRDSIDPTYNECEVTIITEREHAIEVFIRYEDPFLR